MSDIITTCIFVAVFVARLIYTQIFVFIDRIICGSFGRESSFTTNDLVMEWLMPSLTTKIINGDKYFGGDNTHRVIYVSEHPGLYDGPLLEYALHRAYGASPSFVAKNLSPSGPLGWIFSVKNLFYLLGNDRFDSTNRIVMVENHEKLGGESGYQSVITQVLDTQPPNLWIFPSGSVECGEFRTGPFKIAKELGYKICPVTVTGFPTYLDTGIVYPVDEDLASIEIEFHEPFSVGDVSVARDRAKQLCGGGYGAMGVLGAMSDVSSQGVISDVTSESDSDTVHSNNTADK